MNNNSAKKGVLVIGGGIAGVTVADRLGRAGLDVHLVEKQPELGGRVRDLGCKAAEVCMRCNVCVADRTLRLLPEVPGVHIHTSSRLKSVRRADDGGFTAELVGGSGETVRADSIVIAAGYEPYNPAGNPAYGYGRVPNVITGLEAERQLAQEDRIACAGGKEPKRVAFVLCAGSRTEELDRNPDCAEYCSTVCCAYSLRTARRLKHENPGVEITVFYMDIQNFGKGFDEFLRECRGQLRFVRSRPSDIRVGPDGSALVRFAPEGGAGAVSVAVSEEAFDLVVLSVGIRPPADARVLADMLGVPVDRNGFFGLKGGQAQPDMQQAGIYVAGAGESPKDIAGCIAQAEAVSAMILETDQ